MQVKNLGDKGAKFLTPYRFVQAVFARFGMKPNPRKVKMECVFAKKLLDRLHADAYTDEDITQMIEYTCKGMMDNAAPRDFRMFYSIINNFLDTSVSNEVRGNVQSINLLIPSKEEDVDNPI